MESQTEPHRWGNLQNFRDYIGPCTRFYVIGLEVRSYFFSFRAFSITFMRFAMYSSAERTKGARFSKVECRPSVT